MSETLHPEETVTTIFLIRHGDTKATEEGRLYTDPEAPLTDKGTVQANRLAGWVAGVGPDTLLTSPSRRVRATADIISGKLGSDPQVVDGLDEWSVGEWEGRTYLDIKKKNPELYGAWVADPITNAPPGGESIRQLCTRASSYLKEIVSMHEGKRIALVTHAGIVRGMLVHCLGMPVENFWRVAVSTGGVSRIDYSSNFSTVKFTNFRPMNGRLKG